MRFHKLLGAILASALLLSCSVAAQAEPASSLPLLLPADAPVKLDNICHTVDSLLRQPDTEAVEADYAEALLDEYFGVQVQCKSYVNLWSDPNGGIVLFRAENGEVLRLLGVADGWFKVFCEDTVAYLSADYASLLVYDDYKESCPVNTVRQDLVAEALTWLGTPYRYAGSSRSGTDCSGFTMSIFSQFGYYLPHGAGDQYYQSQRITTEQRDIGDLVFFNWGGGIAHVGIYLGGGTFIHASTSSGVIISSLYESYYANGYVGAGRILPE